MRKNRWLLFALPIAVVLLLGVLAWLWIYPTCCQPAPMQPPISPQAAAPASGQGGTSAAGGKAAAEKAAPAAAAAKPFEFSRLDLDTSKDTAEACLTFSEPLVEGPAAHYEDYVSVPDHPEVSLQASGPRLCLAGLAFGKAYRIEIRAGLPAGSGAKLAAGESVPLSFADKAPIVRFTSTSQFILPRSGWVPSCGPAR